MEKVTVTGFVEKINFEKGNFSIFSITENRHYSRMSAKGFVIKNPADYVGHNVVFTGEIEENKFGKTISFTSAVIQESPIYFWESVAKLQKNVLKEVITMFGSDPSWLLGVHDEVKNKLTSIAGINDKKALKIIKSYKEYKLIKEFMEAVSVYEISEAMAVRIVNHFEEKATYIVLNDPYRLVEVNGFGFKKADEIALRVGVSEKDPKRIIAAFNYVMSLVIQDGSTLIEDCKFMSELNEVLILKNGEKIFKTISQMREFIQKSKDFHDIVYLSENLLTQKKFIIMEGYLLEKIKSSVEYNTFKISRDKALAFCVGRDDYKLLGDEQKEAVINVLTSGSISVVKGFAGTGKTTTTRTLLNIFSDYFNLERSDIVGCALSGVAANRIKNQSGYNSGTIHSVLGFLEEGGFFYNESNPLNKNLVVLDESGMVDVFLFYSLLKAIDLDKTKLIILGDTAQLSPVGAGQPMLDIVNSGVCSTSSLTKIYRTSEDKVISLVASYIRNGERPPILKSYDDVFSYRIDGQNLDESNFNTENQILNIAEKYKFKAPDLNNSEEVINYLYHFQVITPRRTGVLSQDELSKKIRGILLPETGNNDVICKESNPIGLYDKVIHLKNEKMTTTDGEEVKIYNGMVGIVCEVQSYDDCVIVYYPFEDIKVKYTESMFKKKWIGYAWSLTVHKTQGSEYNNIVIPFTSSHWRMLDNQLTYTAITRAKESCHLVGTVKAFHQACTNTDTIKRDTVYQYLFNNNLTSLDILYPN